MVLEAKFPKDIFERLIHIMSKENWSLMKSYFWIVHVIHLLLNSYFPSLHEENEKVRLTDTEGNF